MWVTILAVVAGLYLLDFSLRLMYYVQSGKRLSEQPRYRFNVMPFGVYNIILLFYYNSRNEGLERLTLAFKAFNRKTFMIQSFGGHNVMTIDPENIKTVLATNFKDFDLGLRHPQLGAFLGDGIFTLSGDGWKHSRTMLRPQFSRHQVAQLESLKVHGAHLLNRINGAYKNGEFVDLQDLFHKLTMDTATEFLFGDSVDSLNDSQRLVNGVTASQYVKDYDICLTWSLRRIVLGPLYYLVNPKSFQEAVARSRTFVDYFVQRALKITEKGENTETDSYVFTEQLAKVTRDPIVIRDQAFNVLLAGRDTTASLLSYTMFYLGTYPEVWNKLRQSILDTFGTETDEVTFESIKKCQYLQQVINETLRLNPIVPRNFRTAVRDTWLPHGGGADESKPVFVPKGAQVVYSIYTMQRDPSIWGEDADEFRPERWSEERSHGWDYIPFNGGPRICLGQQFALTETSFTLILLAQKYARIELRDHESKAPRNFIRLTSNVKGGVWAKLHPAKA